jgi:3-deoxy-7-phosphoheptulonate synthase
MIITLDSHANPQQLLDHVKLIVRHYEGVSPRLYEFQGTREQVTEIHLIGDTQEIPTALFDALLGVSSVVRVSKKYRIIGRHPKSAQPVGFEYNGVKFDDATINLFAGVCAVDTQQNVAEMMRALKDNGIFTTRMGAYKPRTSPYDFQGLGKDCLPWLFEMAGQHGIKIVAMEVCDERHVEEVHSALEASGNATGVMLQVGTRNAQNFELLKVLGQQRTFPVLFKRGMGITLEEALNACEYIASEGNANIVFCLRGVKSHLSEPHRNMVDFAQVPVVRRLTRLPICIDPSHSVGSMSMAPDGLPEIVHATGQGIICGATMVLIEFHPHPMQARCDGHQALQLHHLPLLKKYIETMRSAYEAALGIGGW